MKPILLVIMILSGYAAGAQVRWKTKPMQPFSWQPRMDTTNILMYPQTLLPAGLGIRTDSIPAGIVYALPLDRMPCIVPDLKKMEPMPNPGSSLLRRSIDPGIYHQRLLPPHLSR